MLVVEQVGVQDLELAQAAVAVAQRALDDLSIAARIARAVGEQPQQAPGVLLGDEAVEAGAEQLIRRIAEDVLGGGALVGDRGVRSDDGDQIAGVLHERGEALLAAAALDLRCQSRLLLRECALAVGGLLLLAHESDHAHHDEAEQDHRGADDHDQVEVAAVQLLQQDADWRDQRGAGEQRSGAAASAWPRGRMDRLVQVDHRGM